MSKSICSLWPSLKYLIVLSITFTTRWYIDGNMTTIFRFVLQHIFLWLISDVFPIISIRIWLWKSYWQKNRHLLGLWFRALWQQLPETMITNIYGDIDYPLGWNELMLCYLTGGITSYIDHKCLLIFIDTNICLLYFKSVGFNDNVYCTAQSVPCITNEKPHEM